MGTVPIIMERFLPYLGDLHVFFTSLGLLATSQDLLSKVGRLPASVILPWRQMVWVELDSNQRKLSLANLQSASFSHSDIHPNKPVMGIEPATDGLQNRCSTTELHQHNTFLAARFAPP